MDEAQLPFFGIAVRFPEHPEARENEWFVGRAESQAHALERAFALLMEEIDGGNPRPPHIDCQCSPPFDVFEDAIDWAMDYEFPENDNGC